MSSAIKVLTSVVLSVVVLRDGYTQQNPLPLLSVRHVGNYSAIPWPVPGVQFKKGDSYDRTKELDSCVVCIWARTDEDAQKTDVNDLIRQIEAGYNG